MDDSSRLRLVIEVLNSSGAKWWIDHGTLLGLIREARLLPWDSDIDLSILSSDLDKIKQGLFLAKPELQAWLIKTNRNLKIVPYNKRERTVEISFYTLNSDDIYIKHLLSYPRPDGENKYLLRRATWKFLRIIEQITRIVDRATVKNNNKVLLQVNKSVSLSTEKITAIKEATGFLHASKVPKAYFERLKVIDWNNLKLMIPENPEKYLAFRYGEEWQIPKPEWKLKDEDMSVVR